MKTKNLLLAVLILTGMNCPINTNTAATSGLQQMATDMAWRGAKDLAWLGALSAGIAATGIATRVMWSDPHTTNQIGSVHVTNPDVIKHFTVRVNMGNKRFSGNYTWTEKNNDATKKKFIAAINTKFNMTEKQNGEFSYEVSLELKRNNKKILLSGKLQDNHITLEGGNLADKLWDNVISHYLILQSECKTGDDWKTANQLPNFEKCSVEHSTEMSNSHYIHTVGSVGSMIAPIAATSYVFGIPKTWSQAGLYTAAAGTGCILQNMWGDVGPGVDLQIPGSKEVFTDIDRERVTRLVEDFIVEQSVINNEDVTFEQWEREKTRLSEAHTNALTAVAKGNVEDEIEAYANEAQTFLRTDIVTLTDKVSGLKFAYAPTQTTVKTGLLAPDNIYQVDNLLPDLSTGDFKERIGRLATATGNGISRIGNIFFGGNTRHRRRGGNRGHRTL